MPRPAPNKKPKPSSRDPNKMGIFSVPDLDTGDDDLDLGDDDLEAELNAILASGPATTKPKRPPPKPLAATDNLDRMVADSMRDISSDDDASDVENDPSLLAELDEVTGTAEPEEVKTSENNQPYTFSSMDTLKLLNERIAMYKQAEENSKAVGDNLKSRRLGRGLKTLNDLVKKAEAGAVITETDIPMPVSITSKNPPKPNLIDQPPEIFAPLETDSELPAPLLPQRAAPCLPPRPSLVQQPEEEAKQMEIPPSTPESSNVVAVNQMVMDTLTERRDQYKRAALIAKKQGNTTEALGFVRIAKGFETVIEAALAGRGEVDLSAMPPPPPGFDSPTNSEQAGTPAISPPPVALSVGAPPDQQTNSEEGVTELRGLPSRMMGTGKGLSVTLDLLLAGIPPPPANVMEALEQRLAKFQEQEENAKKEGNSSKVRRMGRIVKQYQDAIKLHKAGKPIAADELPTPPGYAPIPGTTVPSVAAPPPAVPSPVPAPAGPISPARPAPAPEKIQGSPVSQRSSNSVRSNDSKTRQEKQLDLLLQKQKQFKEAALRAKQTGDIKLAKEYLRQSKQFEPLIEATQNGIPVNLSSLPVPPGSSQAVEKEYEIVKMADCLPGNTSEIYNQLITDLQQQLKLCMETRAHFKAIGDVASANKFEQLAVSTKKDLDTVKIACNKDAIVPKFHYERREFEIVRCNTDLTDNEIEISIIQGINYNVPNPKEIDTYVRFEFPAPTNEEPKRDKTSTVYNTNNPSYEAKFVLPAPRSNRTFVRLFKRQSLKLELWSRGGFLRSDTLVGSVNVKLQPLESKCTIHDSFDIMDGRRPLGGKLEVKIRLRHPIHSKQIEVLQEKWLVID